MQNVSDTVSNLRQQVTGRSKGTYARLPTEFNDELQITAAGKLKSAMKRTIEQDKYKFNQSLEHLNEDIPQEQEYFNKSMASRTIAKCMERKKK